MDPMSKELHTYLRRLEEQQRQVLEIIAGKRRELNASRLRSSQTAGRSSRDVAPQPLQGRESASAITFRRISTTREGSILPKEKSHSQAKRLTEERRAASVVSGFPQASSELGNLGTRESLDTRAALPPIKTRISNAGILFDQIGRRLPNWC
jgi:hypothetical protein